MNKVSSISAVLICLSMLPAYSAAADIPTGIEAAVQISSDTSPIPDLTVTSVETASETLSASGSTVPDAAAGDETASPTTIIPPEPDIFTEPFAGTTLSRLKRRLQNIDKAYGQARETSGLALAISAAESDDRYFRRNCELLVRVSRQQPLAAFAAMAILPEFSGVAEELLIGSVEQTIEAIGNESGKSLQQRELLLADLEKQLARSAKIAAIQRQAAEKIAGLISQVSLINRRRHVSRSPAGLLKSYNDDLLSAVLQQQKRMIGLLNQHGHHYDFCINQIYYLYTADVSRVQLAVRLNQILRSSRDFIEVLKDYHAGTAKAAEQIALLLERHQEGLTRLLKRHDSRTARIGDFMTHYPARDVSDIPEPQFKADKELSNTFILLREMAPGSAEADGSAGKLRELLLSYLDGRPWVARQQSQEVQPEAKSAPAPTPAPTSDEPVSEIDSNSDI